MLKYRRLNNDELKELEKEFIHFLAANGIDAPKWQQLKAEKIDEAEHFIDAFSNVVLEKSLSKINYIEHKTPTDYKVFFYDKDEAFFYGLKSQKIDLLQLDISSVEEVLKTDNIQLLKASKKYTTTREQELFDMIQKGCSVTDHSFYLLLKQLA